MSNFGQVVHLHLQKEIDSGIVKSAKIDVVESVKSSMRKELFEAWWQRCGEEWRVYKIQFSTTEETINQASHFDPRSGRMRIKMTLSAEKVG